MVFGCLKLIKVGRPIKIPDTKFEILALTGELHNFSYTVIHKKQYTQWR
jgi:hypothetical protein